MSAVAARNKSSEAAAKRPAQRTKVPAARQQIIETHLRETIDPERCRAMVAEAAYFYAEHRGFGPGHEIDDWLAAEDQIRATLSLMDQQANALLHELER
jgi:hypothetical protein